MRKAGMGIALVVGLLPSVANAAPAFRWTGHGSSAAVHFETLSDDGCILTSGELVVTSAPSIGTQGIVLGTTEDTCSLDENGDPTTLAVFFGGGEVTHSYAGLASATVSGSIPTTSIFGTAPTVDFDISLAGTGAVSTTSSRFISTVGGVTLSFNAQRQRFANASGTLSLDGEAAGLSQGQLFTETAGELVILNK